MRSNLSLSYLRHSAPLTMRLFRALLALLVCSTFATTPLQGQRKVVFDLNKAPQQLEQRVNKGVAITFTLNSPGASSQGGYTWLQRRRFMLSMPGMEATFGGTTLRTISQKERTYALITPSEQDLTVMNPLTYIQKASQRYRITERRSPRDTVIYRSMAKSGPGPLAGVKYYEVTFDQQSQALKKVDLYFDLDEQVSYTIRKMQAKEHVTLQSFTFAPQEYKSLEVVDLR